MRELKWEEAKKEIKTGTVFLEFFTTWCGDCTMMEPIVSNAEVLIKEKRDDVKFIKVNAEEANLYKKNDHDFNITNIPSFFAIEDGQITLIGKEYIPIEKLIDKF